MEISLKARDRSMKKASRFSSTRFSLLLSFVCFQLLHSTNLSLYELQRSNFVIFFPFYQSLIFFFYISAQNHYRRFFFRSDWIIDRDQRLTPTLTRIDLPNLTPNTEQRERERARIIVVQIVIPWDSSSG